MWTCTQSWHCRSAGTWGVHKSPEAEVGSVFHQHCCGPAQLSDHSSVAEPEGPRNGVHSTNGEGTSLHLTAVDLVEACGTQTLGRLKQEDSTF